MHRGPDDEGIYIAPHIGLGQRRLSIIDLRRSAAPPLSNEDGTIWIVFNGEIYNFQQLRHDLLEKGHSFRTSTDTETIIHLYEEYGTECLQYLRGMFAFALWDAKAMRLFAARDRLGKKPFYYTKNSASFLFGSEIKALSAAPEVSSIPNFSAIDSYLTYSYVPSPLTAFSDIYKLPPAHFLTCNIKGEVKIERYWSPPLVEKTNESRTEIKNSIMNQLREAVKLRLISDVPLGAFLSGGIDSGIVVALMAMESSKPVKTFSIGFKDDEFNELPYAKLVAKKYGTEHHEFVVTPSAVDILPLLVRHYNEPFADSSALPTYYVSKMTRKHVTVALSGDGGDESFSGYHRYGQMLQWEKADLVPWRMRRPVFGSLEALIARLPYTNSSARIKRAFHMLGSNVPERYLLTMTMLKQEEKRAIYTQHFRALAGESSYSQTTPWSSNMDNLDWMMRHDQNYYLPDCLMVKADIASMANGLELRAPFLDHLFVEFAASIPSAMKRDRNGGKRILLEMAKPLLPVEILNKPKSGFGVPLAKWFRGELSSMLRSMLLDDVAAKRGLFDKQFMTKMVEEQISGSRDWSNRLWAFLFLEMWFREFID